jgi:sulfate adenylyltransferase
MIEPHGGKLIDRVMEEKERQSVFSRIKALPGLDVSQERAFEVENITTGVFSPLEGFLGRKDFESVLSKGRLINDVPWTIPIVLDVTEEKVAQLKDKAILYFNHQPLALLHVEGIYGYDKELMAQQVYKTTNENHPGIQKIKAMGEKLVGGRLDQLNPVPAPFPKYKLTPKETRVLFQLKNWRTVVGFQTRNVPHVGHEYVQKTGLTFVDGLFINPVIGKKKPGDFKDEVIIATYETLMKSYYLKDTAVLATLQMEMRYAGPREAIHHAIIRKNFGCTHFIVGRDHAGVGDFYPPYAAQDIFQEYPDIRIVPLFFRSFFYCRKCGSVVNEKICPHGGGDKVTFSGTKLRKILQSGESVEDKSLLIRPEVEKIVKEHPEPFVT